MTSRERTGGWREYILFYATHKDIGHLRKILGAKTNSPRMKRKNEMTRKAYSWL